MTCRVKPGICVPNRVRGWTLIEVLIGVAVIAILAAIGLTMYRSGVQTSRVKKTIAEIKIIQLDIDNYHELYDEYPLSLDDVGHGDRLDAWDNPYEFLNYDTVKGKKGMRKDKKLKPLNSDYDLFSTGPDGDWKPPLNAKASRDDIVRALDGEFVGIADDF